MKCTSASSQATLRWRWRDELTRRHHLQNSGALFARALILALIACGLTPSSSANSRNDRPSMYNASISRNWLGLQRSSVQYRAKTVA